MPGAVPRYEAGMCGIAALFAYHSDAPPVAPRELEAINDAMRRRGPDGEGLWIDDAARIGLAHRRLAIIDLSDAGAQPMKLALDGRDARYWITYNGEIYNFRELRSELEAGGAAFTSESNTEVILKLFERHGPAMLPKLRGMFAMAIWDADARTLFLARDPFGIKPLYYADDGRSFRCASQVKALVAGGAVATDPDPAGHVGFFLFGSVPEPHTLYSTIRALPAGHWMEVGPDGARRARRYYDLADAFADGPDPDRSDGAFREALVDSVRHHFVSDVPVGVFLSAGIDSTAVTGLAAECQGHGLDTVTLGFEEFRGSDRDETVLAEEVARLYATRHRTVIVSRGDFQAAYDDILDVMDQPSIDGINTYFVAKAAASTGLKVALSGLGGDELLGGYDTFDKVPAWVSRASMVPARDWLGPMLRTVARPFVPRSTSPKAAGFIEYAGTLAGAYLLKRSLFMPWELSGLMDREAVRQGMAALDPLRRLEDLAAGPDLPERQIGLLETGWYMKNQLLRDADWAGMAHSLEIRVPLVDAALRARLGPMVLRSGGPTKKDLALAPAPGLPASLRDRPKTGFFIPVERWAADRSTAGAGANEHGLRAWARTVYEATTTPLK